MRSVHVELFNSCMGENMFMGRGEGVMLGKDMGGNGRKVGSGF